MLFAYTLLGGSALFIVYQDLKDQTLPWAGLVVFGGVSLYQVVSEANPESLGVGVGIAALFIACQSIFYLIKHQPAMGWGDLILSPFCGFWLQAQELPLYLIFTGVIALLTGVLWRYRWGMKTFPMAPALLLGLGFVLLIRCFLTMNRI